MTMMVVKSRKSKQELVINGVLVKQNVVDFTFENGLWTFVLDDGAVITATGSVMFVGHVEKSRTQ